MTSPDPFAQAVMVAYCGWDPTTPITETVQMDGNGTRLLTLPSLYVTAVTAVTITDGWGTTSARTVAATATPTVGDAPSTDVGWSPNGCLTWNGWSDYNCWPPGQRNIAVTYTGGYDYTPDDLTAVLTSLSSRMPLVGAASQHAGPFGVTYATPVAAGGLLLVEQMVLDRYRIPRAA